MRVILLFLPAIAMAQTPPPKAPAATPKAATGTAKALPKAPPKAAPSATLATDDDKAIYSLGLQMYKTLAQFDLSPAEMEIIKRAITDAAAGKPALDPTPYTAKLGAMASERRDRVAKSFLSKAAAQPGAVKTDSGIIYKDLKPGTGASPKASDTVKVNYKGTLPDGTEFDSSYKRNAPATFPLSGVIKCWTEGVQRMKVGGKAQLTCPSNLAYGDRGSPPTIPGGATLIFEIELLDIVH